MVQFRLQRIGRLDNGRTIIAINPFIGKFSIPSNLVASTKGKPEFFLATAQSDHIIFTSQGAEFLHPILIHNGRIVPDFIWQQHLPKTVCLQVTAKKGDKVESVYASIHNILDALEGLSEHRE